MHDVVVRDLAERPVTFNYDYRMRCDCSAEVNVTAATYHREQSREAQVPCHTCGELVHFGPAVTVIRDPADPALTPGALNTLAWYHTSTWADWPSANYADIVGPVVGDNAAQFGIDRDLAIDVATSSALHVGTYEAAIENMFRRMKDQSDGGSKFFLHRVELTVETDRVNDGYRDENAEAAAQLKRSELAADDLDAIRYLNVHEARGSLSVAIHPKCITAVQTIEIPRSSHTPLPANVTASLDETEHEIGILSETAASIRASDDRRDPAFRLACLRDKTGPAAKFGALERQIRTLWKTVDDTLSDLLLVEISPVVADDLNDALGAWRTATDTGPNAYGLHFARTAALLSAADEVIADITNQVHHSPSPTKKRSSWSDTVS